ncbi:hypothetical protein HA42_19875 [Pantoea deleyi]|uniref:Uncharacterized protein n=1 Tax=Pantoea deleyi TaxID=470932 RepID=A0A506PV26_9GAMM|nr:hypothetical protein [Pantoea deleyi]ORM75836.1 hypothetical protein HA42_19875 [Pantoea deleyi]TPV37257.1 hypothetical protein FJW01_19395 [Pantoea deleyi]
MNIQKAIETLIELIALVEAKNKSQGKELYKSALDVLKDENCSNIDSNTLYGNFCGYLAHGEFDEEEYQKVLQLISFLKK